jgi:hypothetical protein
MVRRRQNPDTALDDKRPLRNLGAPANLSIDVVTRWHLRSAGRR